MERKGSDTGTERLFIAVKLPNSPGESLAYECRALSAKLNFAKWTHSEDYHITLQFLGDTPKRSIPAVLEALKKASSACSPFQLQLDNWGTFGLPDAPKVLWAGVSGEIDKLRELQRLVISVTRPLGFIPEAREFKPHITLARKYRDEQPFSLGRLAVLRARESASQKEAGTPDWTVDGFVVYATRMHAIPMYEMIEKLTFF
ncbi:RNA 2',3'-cyclic phosphodiesterase [Paenibacillus sp. S150]|uniref:RNA 2',3'-cyclic phosphodiesterase n=1 Tax=Paenibacillus sp. S150 TaxID=2749826 RepID=UPI001C5621EF|nr:RNA 2',3'-cyclic phosphodiesterase [Paenibacillus sp. S150]MBW4081396.1 RNA 2',3'-cyclic phosphodiesterase [Paenibacillus sp. S150]